MSLWDETGKPIGCEPVARKPNDAFRHVDAVVRCSCRISPSCRRTCREAAEARSWRPGLGRGCTLVPAERLPRPGSRYSNVNAGSVATVCRRTGWWSTPQERPRQRNKPNPPPRRAQRSNADPWCITPSVDAQPICRNRPAVGSTPFTTIDVPTGLNARSSLPFGPELRRNVGLWPEADDLGVAASRQLSGGTPAVKPTLWSRQPLTHCRSCLRGARLGGSWGLVGNYVRSMDVSGEFELSPRPVCGGVWRLSSVASAPGP
jgi:hypothetical protein